MSIHVALYVMTGHRLKSQVLPYCYKYDRLRHLQGKGDIKQETVREELLSVVGNPCVRQIVAMDRFLWYLGLNGV